MDRILLGERRTLRNQKALPPGRKSLGSASRSDVRLTLPATIHAVGPGHSPSDDLNCSAHTRKITIRRLKINRMNKHSEGLFVFGHHAASQRNFLDHEEANERHDETSGDCEKDATEGGDGLRGVGRQWTAEVTAPRLERRCCGKHDGAQQRHYD